MVLQTEQRSICFLNQLSFITVELLAKPDYVDFDLIAWFIIFGTR